MCNASTTAGSSNEMTNKTKNLTVSRENSNADVPEVLVSILKDGRYVTQFANLLSNFVVKLSGINSSDEFRPELKFISAFIHFILITFRRGRSMGMEHVQLEYSRKIRPSFFGFWFILLPYFIERFKRDGWGELRNVLTCWKIQNSKVKKEDLRGAARRKIFEEERRRMIERIDVTEEVPRPL